MDIHLFGNALYFAGRDSRGMNLYRVKKYLRYLKELFLYVLFFLIVKPCSSNEWLISERGTDARDNAYWLYKYIKANHPEIEVKYVITRTSPDIKKIEPADVVLYRSKEHYKTYIRANCLISTHYEGCSPDLELFTKLTANRIIRHKNKIVFLQHGITKDAFVTIAQKRPLDLFIMGAKPEYQSAIETTGYADGVIQYTGFPRFDNLWKQEHYTNNEKNYILVMPTWRLDFSNMDCAEFVTTQYYKAYQELLTNEQIWRFLEETGSKLLFYPHSEVQRFIHMFRSEGKDVVIASAKEYDVQQLLIESRVLITDYSSVYFDFAYLHKPVLYYHFDYKYYRSLHLKQGWFDYSRNGFGPICKTLKELTVELTRLKNNNFCMDDKFIERINAIFELNDMNNSERVFRAIQNMK